MTDKQSLLARASERKAGMKLDYAGALNPAEAWALTQADPAARIVDVRTEAEWAWVGQPPGVVSIEWNQWPQSTRNPDFLAELGKEVPKDVPVMFLCRSGVRSHGAAIAATQAGWSCAINILEGFEGDKDASGQRNKLGGWRKAGLPWSQP